MSYIYICPECKKAVDPHFPYDNIDCETCHRRDSLETCYRLDTETGVVTLNGKEVKFVCSLVKESDARHYFFLGMPLPHGFERSDINSDVLTFNPSIRGFWNKRLRTFIYITLFIILTIVLLHFLDTLGAGKFLAIYMLFFINLMIIHTKMTITSKPVTIKIKNNKIYFLKIQPPTFFYRQKDAVKLTLSRGNLYIQDKVDPDNLFVLPNQDEESLAFIQKLFVPPEEKPKRSLARIEYHTDSPKHPNHDEIFENKSRE